MTYTVDANVLVYASDDASDHQGRARSFLRELAEGTELVYLFWPTLMAYLRIATHPSIFETPLPPEAALANVETLLEPPQVRATGEGGRFWAAYRRLATEGDARGNLVPDAHIVALMDEHGVRTIWTHDRDYRRFPGIEVRDPFA